MIDSTFMACNDQLSKWLKDPQSARTMAPQYK
jgi:hypothetical protein